MNEVAMNLAGNIDLFNDAAGGVKKKKVRKLLGKKK